MKGAINYWLTATVMLISIAMIFIIISPAYDAVYDLILSLVSGNASATNALSTSKLMIRLSIMVFVISLMILVVLSAFRKEYETGYYQRY